MAGGGTAREKAPLKAGQKGGDEMFNETVHNSHFKERLTLEVSVDKSTVLMLLKQVVDTSKDLVRFSNALMAALEVQEETETVD